MLLIYSIYFAFVFGILLACFEIGRYKVGMSECLRSSKYLPEFETWLVFNLVAHEQRTEFTIASQIANKSYVAELTSNTAIEVVLERGCIISHVLTAAHNSCAKSTCNTA